MLLLAAALMLGAGFFGVIPSSTHDSGICLPSPNLWPIIPLWSKIINGAAIGGFSLWIWFLNKGYNFVRNSGFTVPAIFVILAASNPFITGAIDTSTLLLAFWLLCFSVLFDCYRQRNSTQEIFLVSTFLSIGSMIDYAYLVMAPMVIIAAVMLKAMRLREFLAFLMGLIAPYWIGLGFGLLKPEDFHVPQFANFTNGAILPSDMLTMSVGVGIISICAVLGALNTAVKLYAGNPQTRTYNYAVYILAIYSLACMVFDSSHLLSYIQTLYFGIAVMFGNLLALNNIPKTNIWVWSIAGLSVLYWALLLF